MEDSKAVLLILIGFMTLSFNRHSLFLDVPRAIVFDMRTVIDGSLIDEF